ncbi:hypothetical protein RFI_21057 [Reticulomyxa filosa]|uniref:Uncharacterized protein n=1 Tax=Reticulomyxa filosa TaxID=46433 RepID=X6MS62_RETFI|nr:hypothetical protein RFI_21057 [Reticulomyxa filosa]|eukprot:ETO16297.1 hypothetical protein RFI_21057 [Reticulomyxa filosa]
MPRMDKVEQKENKDCKQKIVRKLRFDIYLNKYVMLRELSARESDSEIKETLEDYGYQNDYIICQLLKCCYPRLKILKDNDIKIGYSMVKVQPFDKGKSGQKLIPSNAGNTTDCTTLIVNFQRSAKYKSEAISKASKEDEFMRKKLTNHYNKIKCAVVSKELIFFL